MNITPVPRCGISLQPEVDAASSIKKILTDNVGRNVIIFTEGSGTDDCGFTGLLTAVNGGTAMLVTNERSIRRNCRAREDELLRRSGRSCGCGCGLESAGEITVNIPINRITAVATRNAL